jgi:hypothetical protein
MVRSHDTGSISILTDVVIVQIAVSGLLRLAKSKPRRRFKKLPTQAKMSRKQSEPGSRRKLTQLIIQKKREND